MNHNKKVYMDNL